MCPTYKGYSFPCLLPGGAHAPPQGCRIPRADGGGMYTTLRSFSTQLAVQHQKSRCGINLKDVYYE
jgi:hypothetical protein